jgi:aspartate kinase
MKVFKFGGASVKDAAAVRNTAAIIQQYTDQPLLVVVSAMGKTTNALERVVTAILRGQDYSQEVASLQQYHFAIAEQLFPKNAVIFEQVEAQLMQIENFAKGNWHADALYDQIVSIGELISTLIVHAYVNEQNKEAMSLDARQYVFTDATHREGKVDWEKTKAKIRSINFKNDSLYVTQGFIGSSPEGTTTTLGREGSDYTAAIFASCLQAQSVTIWKDVLGVMSADPKRLPNATVFDELPFKEAAEMTYYGASVIHPKTIKPLANAGIPLLVKNFDDPSLNGTRIHECRVDDLPPLIVFKENQCLISCKVIDYTFIDEYQLGLIFKILSELDVKINLMQNSAISFTFCVDFRESKVLLLIEKLQAYFEVYYNTGLTLITIKNYDDATFETYRKGQGVILEQSSRSTLQVLVRQ